MALSQPALIELTRQALNVVEARAGVATPLADRLAAEAAMGALQARLQPSQREMASVLEAVAIWHQQLAREALAWGQEIHR